MFICLVLYWDEKLYNKVEVGRVTRNVLRPNLSRTFRHKGSSKIMIFQNHLDFVNSSIRNGHFTDMDPVKHYNILSIYKNHYKKQFFANVILLFSQSTPSQIFGSDVNQLQVFLLITQILHFQNIQHLFFYNTDKSSH